MKTQKIIKMVWFMGFMIVLCNADVFAATSADELYQKAISAMEQRDTNTAMPLFDAILASNDANDILRIRMHQLRARFNLNENPEYAKSECNMATMIAKDLISERLNGNTNLSQNYLIRAYSSYGAAVDVDRILFCRDGMYNEAASISRSYSEDILKLGPFFDVNGRQKIIDFAIEGWREAGVLMTNAKQLAEAHNIYKNAEQILSGLIWTTPEMTEKAIYTMQMGALITSDVNDKVFGAAAAELIEKNKGKPWIVHSSVYVEGMISYERQYELYTALIKAQPTNADDNSMALLYRLAYTTAKEIGRPEEAVNYYKTLKQKYPNESVSALP
jgi:tetratricopeptide (TPR) repeat protein